MPFTVEELAMAPAETEIYKCSAFLKKETISAGRCGEIKTESDEQINILPLKGTAQVRKEGELFNIWLLLSEKSQQISLASEFMKGKAINAKFFAELPDKGYLYGGSIKAINQGRFSLTVTIDEKTIDIPSCLIVT